MIVFLFSGLYWYHENITPEWWKHQHNYLEQIETAQASNTSDKDNSSSFAIELRQIWLPEMNRADRCVSCHVAMEDPGFVQHTNPLKAHPATYFKHHDLQKYGCTICHDGQGRAINFKDAIADDPDVFWNKPILRKPFIEANCYRCHVDLLDQTPSYNQGKQLFETRGCLGCHKRFGKGGFAGPELVGIGDASTHLKYPKESFDQKILPQLNGSLNLAYIYEAARFPGAQPENTLMFDFKLSHEDTMAVTVYLKSLAALQPGTHRLAPKPVSLLPIIEQGEKIFHQYCTACHGKNGRGGVKNRNYKNDFIPRLNTLADQMFLHKKQHQDAVIALLDEYSDLLDAGRQPDIPGFFKVVAKYMPVKNIIESGLVAEKKDIDGPSPLNMPAWGKSLTEKEVASVIAYLISVY